MLGQQTGQRVGYVRVSSFDENPERQLEGTPVDRTFSDKASGKDVKRPQFDALMNLVHTGDIEFVKEHGESSLPSSVERIECSKTQVVRDLGISRETLHQYLKLVELDQPER